MSDLENTPKPEERVDVIRQRLAVLEPIELEVLNDSHLHAQHAGNRDGANHFTVTMRSAKFDGCVQRSSTASRACSVSEWFMSSLRT